MPPKRACDICYRRKIQCLIPAEGPPCDWCSHHDSECTFHRDAPRRKKKAKVTLGDVQGLNNRIQQLEDALAKANSQQPIQPDTPNQGQPTPAISVSEETPNSASVQSTIPATIQNSIAFSEQSLSPLVFSQTPASVDDTHITPSADGSRPGSYIGPNWFFRGIHAFSEDGRRWISSKTGQTIDWSKLQIFTAKPSPFAKLHAQLSPDRCHLPDQASLRELLSSYLNSSFRLRFPLIDKVLFEDTINEAYGDPDNILPPPVRLAARACVFGAVSLMTFLPDAQPGSLGLDGNESAARASYLLSQLIGYASLATLQTTLLLHVQRLLCGYWQEADSLLPAACRTVGALGGHLCQPSNALTGEISLSERRKQHVRNLFWVCYMSDKDSSLRTGQPPLLADIYCDVTIPENYLSSYTYLRGLDEHLHPPDASGDADLTPHFSGDAQLGFLKEKVYRLLYSVQALSDKDNRLLISIRELDDEIECWRLSVPVDFRPALSVSLNTLLITPETKLPHLRRYFHLLLEYWYLMIYVHTTVRRYDAHTIIGDGGQDLHRVIHSSYDLSMEAGRSTLRCLRVCMNTFSNEGFWLLMFYATNAAIALFLNMIIHPEDTDGQLDLELLISAANAIRTAIPRTPTREESTRIQRTSDFIMRLMWLGSCAITKSQEEGLQHEL
ncbi:fungal-specific transcription factor [Colletotrichum acutatum]|uniref:Fungal-specific transcription factor n=1 Tax=Glomerella acutata TaxID=27357 RepID=A0AAD8XCZ3_GLOAC|nr:fungal-specific transcription factor [Colletotrichum acutatum]KAK1722637.1 fungal-specific transcription factor [Colletotrichum acutatum]